MTDDSKERARAQRDYAIGGALAIAAAIVGIADQGLLARIPPWLVVAGIAAGAVALVLVARRALRPDDGSGPTVERMRKMASLWSLLAIVLCAAVLRGPWATLREAGPAGLRPREWAAAAAGLAIGGAAIARIILSWVRRGRPSAGQG